MRRYLRDSSSFLKLYSNQVGTAIVFVPNDEYGQIDTKMLETLIDEQVKLISINHIPTGGGLVNPVAEVGRIANAAGVPFLLDACQSAGQIPVDVQAIGCDMASGTGRKYLRGPRGTGFLYVRENFIENLEPPLLDNHAAELISPTEYVIRSDAKRFENWEQFLAGKAALGAAIDYALTWGIEAIQARIYSLAIYLRENLSLLDGVTLTDEGQEQCGLVTFLTEQKSAGEIRAALAAKNINVSVAGYAWNLVSFKQRGLRETVRASVHYFNTQEEIDIFTATLKKILAAP